MDLDGVLEWRDSGRHDLQTTVGDDRGYVLESEAIRLDNDIRPADADPLGSVVKFLLLAGGNTDDQSGQPGNRHRACPELPTDQIDDDVDIVYLNVALLGLYGYFSDHSEPTGMHGAGEIRAEHPRNNVLGVVDNAARPHETPSAHHRVARPHEGMGVNGGSGSQLSNKLEIRPRDFRWSSMDQIISTRGRI